MDIPRSTYYYQKTENTVKTQPENYLTEKIKDIAYHHPYYGYRRITAQLPGEKIKVNHKRVLKIMHQLGIQGSLKRSYITTTNSKHSNPIYPNLIKDKVVTGINQIYSSDITYIRILSGFVYLAAIIDLYSRKVVSYAIGKTLSAQAYPSCLKDGYHYQECKKPDSPFRSGYPVYLFRIMSNY
jgi:hypothetical protein